MDISLPFGNDFEQTLPADHNAFVYIIEGELTINNGEQHSKVSEKYLGILSKGEHLSITASSKVRFLLLAGRPLNEPVVRGGPFVMNTKKEVLQAFEDYQHGLFG